MTVALLLVTKATATTVINFNAPICKPLLVRSGFFVLSSPRLNIFTKKSMSNLINEFNDYRTKMNEVILSKDNLVIKRLWNLDTNTYAEGALDTKTKEMLGLVASMVLRCDDCIKYHLGKNHEMGVTTEQMYEIFAVANIVGGTIVIPHTRRAAEYWEELITAK
jgi:AhpD family alkylhydroperoxidase